MISLHLNPIIGNSTGVEVTLITTVPKCKVINCTGLRRNYGARHSERRSVPRSGMYRLSLSSNDNGILKLLVSYCTVSKFNSKLQDIPNRGVSHMMLKPHLKDPTVIDYLMEVGGRFSLTYFIVKNLK